MNSWSTVIRRNSLFRIFTSFQVRYRSSNWKHKAPNPGIQKRLRLLAIENDDTTDEMDEFDELESDFMTVDREHAVHERELEEEKFQRQLKIVGRKYFRNTKEPKLLTWEEQEQIRHLHKSDPGEWSAEKLARSFPATESTIQKILSSEWRPLSSKRILKYNESVLANWKLLEKDLLDVSDDLKTHLLRFASRKTVNLPPSHLDITEETSVTVHQQGNSEFGDIIKSYQALRSDVNNAQNNRVAGSKPVSTTAHRPPIADSYVLPSDRKGRTAPTTLDQYRRDILDSISKGKRATKEDKVILMGYRNDFNSNEVYPSPETVENDVTSNIQRSVDSVQWKPNTVSQTKPLPEKIKIPYKYIGKGHLFRIDDTFYDEDGEFLYRVPGMKV